MKRKLVLFLTLFLVGIGVITAQTRVRGTVVDEAGEPIIGATVIIKGTSQATVTDLDGNFTITTPSGGTLVISYVGYVTQEVAADENVRVVLQEDSELLDEVFVVAYGTATKQSFTGSASVVKSDAIGKIQTSSVTNSLEGQAAGVQLISSTGQPGENPSVRIRGVGSINAGKNPLYIVDGATYDGPISTLNSADVESITVLKDAAANSLYGARGANGVILITTKRGAANKQTITFDAKWGVNSRAIPEYDLITDRALYYEQAWTGQYNKLYDNYIGRATDPLTPEAARIQTISDLAGSGANSLSKILGGYNNYNVPWAELIGADGKINPNAKLLYTDDWSDALFDNSLRQEYNLNIGGGDNKHSYYIGLGYLNDDSYAKGSGFERYSGRVRYEKEVLPWLKTGANLAYAHTIQNYPTTSGGSYVNYFQWTRNIAPIYPVFLRDPKTGAIVKDDKGKDRYDYGNETSLGYARPYASKANPAGVLEYDINKITLDNVTGSAFLDAKIYDGLSVRGAFDVNTTYKNGSYLTNPLYGDASANNGYVEKENQRYFSYTGSVFLNYNKTFDKLLVDFLAGAESYKKEYSYLYGSKTNLATSDVPEFNNAVVYDALSSYTQKYSVTGYLSRLNLSYDDKYYLSLSYRRDGSSRFHPDNRWGNFASVGGSWRISQEDFFTNVSFVDDLKVKGSIGSQGNDNLLYEDGTINYLPYQDQFEVSNNDDRVSVKQTYIGNKDISWEKSINANIGIEGRLFNRLNISLEYYNKTTNDMLFSIPVALSTGVRSQPGNIGKVRNSGFELETDFDIVRNRDFVWNIGLNAATIKNEVIRLPDANREAGIFASGYTKLVERGSVYDIYLPEFAGVDSKGKNTWNVYNADGSFKETTTVYNNAYTAESRRNQGSAIPDLTGGFSTTLQFKGVDLSLLFSYQLGGKVYDAVYASTLQMSEYGRAIHKDLLNAWTSDNTNTTVPRFVSGYTDSNRASDLYLIDASYLNIRNISLGYTLPKTLLSHFDIQKVRVYASGDNLALFSKRKGLDPRQYDYGTTGFNYSPLRTISFGLNVTL
ncbi:MAG TPA: SusC/RagA family TonB-linked outer membrane protein [Porphyromonadaceae bacterium]|jgi:TonB-linked SusC/RagA family outer membrane protein|nr:SusC/RagA family TonB-linked outer membrane protein [Porphyromonadaceae bacterium]HBX21631.1 SusC/RagA family TonB-linked outer membrane protein [Porphyromonadaceae bacterium]